jgi:hypothetical protein
MSGGAFNYNQSEIEDIITQIEKAIKYNDNDELNDWGDRKYDHFEKKTLKRFWEAIVTLRKAQMMAHRIDWLLSGDDGEEEFHKRWDEEISQ